VCVCVCCNLLAAAVVVGVVVVAAAGGGGDVILQITICYKELHFVQYVCVCVCVCVCFEGSHASQVHVTTASHHMRM
jgi:hypothetical protein